MQISKTEKEELGNFLTACEHFGLLAGERRAAVISDQ
jgi:hypothetical protein